MKTLLFPTALCLLLFSLLLTSCSDDDSQPNDNGNPQSAELMLFSIDTAKVYKMDKLGANAIKVVDKMQNSSSYISDLSVSADGTQLAYSNNQRTFNPESFTTELRVTNADGTNDHAVYSSSEPYVGISAIRFCSDNKIFFVTEFNNPSSRKMYVVNPDGSGLQQIQGQYDLADVSDDRKYYLLAPSGSGNVQIIDKNGDGGAGGLYHNELFTASQTVGAGTFTNDGSKVVIPFQEGNEIKVRIIDVAAKTSTTKTLIGGLGMGWISFHLEMASDSNRGVLTVAGENYTKSKGYVINLATGEVQQPFENNDENVYSVYAN